MHALTNAPAQTHQVLSQYMGRLDAAPGLDGTQILVPATSHGMHGVSKGAPTADSGDSKIKIQIGKET